MAVTYSFVFLLAFVATQTFARDLLPQPMLDNHDKKVLGTINQIIEKLSTDIPVISSGLKEKMEIMTKDIEPSNIILGLYKHLEAEIGNGPKLDACINKMDSSIQNFAKGVNDIGLKCVTQAGEDTSSIDNKLVEIQDMAKPLEKELIRQRMRCFATWAFLPMRLKECNDKLTRNLNLTLKSIQLFSSQLTERAGLITMSFEDCAKEVEEQRSTGEEYMVVEIKQCMEESR